MKAGIKALIIAAFLTAAAQAYKNAAGQYLIYDLSARSAGMGGLGVILPDASNAFWAPAAMGFKKGLGVSFDGMGGQGGDSYSEFNASSRLYGVWNKLALGAEFWRSQDSARLTDSLGNYQSDINWNKSLATFAGAYRTSDKFAFGASVNNLNDDLDGDSSGTGFLNLSAAWKPGKMIFGMSVINMNNAKIKMGDNNGYQVINGPVLSAAWQGNKLSVGGYSEDLYGIDYTGGLGAEYRPLRNFAMRLGMNFTKEDTYGTLGFSLSVGNFAFDYAFQQHPFDDKSVLSVSYKWGGKVVKREERRGKREEGRGKRKEPSAAAGEIVPFESKPARKLEMPAAAEGEKINIAVTDFEARAPLSQSEAAFISDFVRSDLVNSDKFNVVEKNNMSKILAEQGFQQTGCSSAECAVRIGKILNVKMMLVGSCGQLLGNYVITMNVIDVESAKIVYSDDVSVSDPNMLRAEITTLVKKFLNSVQ